MNDDEKLPDRDEAVPQAKRRGRQGTDAGAQPSEFADEMRTNRFTPPPPPPENDDDKT